MRSSFRSFRPASLVAIAAAMMATACAGDSVTQPDISNRDSKITLSSGALSTLVSALTLTRDNAVSAGVVRSFTFTQKGGTIDLRKETGLRIDVPEGAIPGSTLTITVTALAGNAVAYDFQPHGTVFLKPLAFRQDLSNTSWDKLTFKGVVMGGYFKDPAQIDLLHGTALLDELFPVTFNSKEITFEVKHFSGYMVSSGRSSFSSEEY